jgi:hypothetical protein
MGLAHVRFRDRGAAAVAVDAVAAAGRGEDAADGALLLGGKAVEVRFNYQVRAGAGARVRCARGVACARSSETGAHTERERE